MATSLSAVGGKKPSTKKPVKTAVVARKLSKLKPDPNNPRKNDHAVEQLARMIAEFGFRVPVLVRGDDLVDGHLRYKAAEKLGMEDIPTIDVSDMSDQQVLQFRLAVNKAAEFAEWDDDLLRGIFAQLDTMGADLELTGFDPADIQGYLKHLDDHGAFLDGEADADLGEGETTTSKTSHTVARLDFSLTPEDRKAVVNGLRAEQKRRHLATMADALVAVVADLSKKG